MAEHNHELGSLQARVDMILSGQMRLEDRLEKVREEMVEILKHHSTRIRMLELWRAGLAGATAVVGSILGWMGLSK